LTATDGPIVTRKRCAPVLPPTRPGQTASSRASSSNDENLL